MGLVLKCVTNRSQWIRQLVGVMLTTFLAPGGDKLAVAGDDAVVTVVRLAGDTAEVARVAAEHGDMVRGLAWSGPDTLWSAAWDQTVAKYDL